MLEAAAGVLSRPVAGGGAVTEKGQRNHNASTKERGEWLQRWAEERPEASVHQARQAVKEQFAVSLGTTFISRIMREAREKAGLPPARKGRPELAAATTQARVKVLVDELRNLGVRKLEISEEDFRAELVMTGKKD
jgi:hypothetical protein